LAEPLPDPLGRSWGLLEGVVLVGGGSGSGRGERVHALARAACNQGRLVRLGRLGSFLTCHTFRVDGS